jgi:ADP-ribose pyrophosphatase YjhB (NUDIX family)
VRRIHLAHGILERDGRLLLVASRYPNHSQPLWNLPGGRQREGELLEQTVRREFREETGLLPEVMGLRYVAESHDTPSGTHFTSFVFAVASSGVPVPPTGDAHVVACEWVPFEQLRTVLTVQVVCEPLLTYLIDPRRRYFGYAEAGITIEFADEP